MTERTIEIDAPIAVDDVMKGSRSVNQSGKEARSKFKSLGYDSDSDTSLVLCSPLTG
jgi:23S rRNA-/tRNA-specific pseudouridylate synthase